MGRDNPIADDIDLFGIQPTPARTLGYIEGQNLVTKYLNPEREAEGVPGAIRELFCRKVDNIVAPYQSMVKAASTVVLICINDDLLARFIRKT
jgi:hypothetical protein